MLLVRQERYYTSCQNNGRSVPPRPTPEGWLRLARQLRAGSTSPDVRGQLLPRPMAKDRLRLARRPRADSASPDDYTLLLHNDEHRIRQDILVKCSTKDHSLHRCKKVSSGDDGTGALDHSRHGRV